MDLTKIRKLSAGYPGGLKSLAHDTGMSEQNLHRCIKANKIMAGDLETIARLLKVSPLVFFDPIEIADLNPLPAEPLSLKQLEDAFRVYRSDVEERIGFIEREISSIRDSIRMSEPITLAQSK